MHRQHSHIELAKLTIVVLDYMGIFGAIKLWPKKLSLCQFFSYSRFRWVDTGCYDQGHDQDSKDNARYHEYQDPPVAKDVVSEHTKVEEGKEEDEEPRQKLQGVPRTRPPIPTRPSHFMPLHGYTTHTTWN